MKICLISPPTITEFTESQVADSEAIRLLAEVAPLGILSLSAVLEGMGIVPRIVDLNRLYYDYIGSREYHDGQKDFCGFVVAALESEQFDVFGFSTICSSYPLTIRLAREIKRTHPEATIILGGPQASVVDVQTLGAFPWVDLIVRGEAEETFPLVIEALADRHSYDGIQGITFRHEENPFRAPNAPVIADLDSLPLAAFHLYPRIERSRYLPLEIGRGCPFACSFCSTNDFFRRQFRLKSPDKVLAEMKLLKKLYGIEGFDLIHDMFTINRKKVVAFTETLKRSGEKFHWKCSARTDCIDDELIDLMAETGCRGIFFGIDSGSERMQQVMNKRLDLAQAALRIEHSNSQGIETTVSLITGFAEEKKDDLRATVRFLGDSLRFDNAAPQFHLLAPLAETPVTTEYKDRLVFDDIFSDISHQGWQQEASDRELIRSHLDIFTNFYAVPTRWLNRVYLKELREFILTGTRKFRWLFVALHQDCGDLLNVFDEWKAWYQKKLGSDLFPDNNSRVYYLSSKFRADFFDFVKSHYLARVARNPLVVSEIMNYETVRHSFPETGNGSLRTKDSATVRKNLTLRADTRLVHEDNIRVVQTKVDFEDLMRRLRNKERLDELFENPTTLVLRLANELIEVLQLNQHTERLFDLCDGSRTVREIVNSFSSSDESTASIPADKVCLFGLAFLQERALIAEQR